MSPYGRQTRVLGLCCFTLYLLCSCESNTATAPRSVDKPPASANASLDDAPENAAVVVATGDASVDVPAVQTAVDQGGAVILRGHFNFDRAANNPLAPILVATGFAPRAEVLVSQSVSIYGTGNDDSELATIEAGTIPFYVNAPGQQVTIRGLRFNHPTSSAITVHAVGGLEISKTKIDGVVPLPTSHLSFAIAVVGSGIPSPANPGNPEGISGTLRIERNDIDVRGGVTGENTLGVTVFGAGVAGAEVDIHVVGNRIRNITEPGINFRRIVGHADIEHNVIRTGTEIGSAGRSSAIRIANIGSYLVAHNMIRCEWATTDGEGIGVFSQIAAAGWQMQNAVVEDNDIDMRPPTGTVFDDFSAGIGVYGFAQDNVVRHNRIRGTARNGITIPSIFPLPPQAPANPLNNAFLDNRFDHFTPTVADIFVGNHSVGTHIVGFATTTYEDLGQRTIIELRPMLGREHHDRAE